MRSPIDQPGAECTLKIGHRLRNRRLSYGQLKCSFSHAAALRNGEKDLQVAQRHAATGANVGRRGRLRRHKHFLYPYPGISNSGTFWQLITSLQRRFTADHPAE
jgi:hypothetical protein